MDKRIFYNVEEVAAILDVSNGHAYKVIRSLNDELKEQGFIVIAGRIPKAYFNEKYYGLHSVM
ncbi:ICEBs1 excisionase [Anaerosporobacter sp.]|uniref:ICEBs1 excisionase n=1 Tax=Anaerosporobacter sp. TaxID=1872529 RepID=UPI00286F0F9A|nr:ICEBs1 excisionase [Anaerosporobacter sp.]